MSMDIVERTASRYIAATGIPVGKTFYSGSVRIHRFRDQLRFTDMTNAGKRGKRVQELTLSPTYYYKGDTGQWLEDVSEQAVRLSTYDEMLSLARKLKEAAPTEVYLSESTLRGVDVEPAGTKIHIKTQTGLVIESSPYDFTVLDRQQLVHPKTGQPMDAVQDTNYYPVKKQDGVIFYAWLKENLAAANRMTLDELRGVWTSLGVKWDSH